MADVNGTPAPEEDDANGANYIVPFMAMTKITVDACLQTMREVAPPDLDQSVLSELLGKHLQALIEQHPEKDRIREILPDHILKLIYPDET